MKKILTIGCLFIIALSCRAQGIVAVEQSYNYYLAGNGIPDGTYFKDINNLFNNYVGTWKGVYKNRNYTFYITKHTKTFYNVTEDEILVRYLITNLDGSIVEDTRSNADDGDYIISGDMFSKNADYYYMIYAGKDADCGQSGDLILRPKSPTQLKISLLQEKILLDPAACPGGRAIQLMPLEGMILTKQ
jgi:ribulose-5-phosphate 4-epimerase/fuculose-1-phosphate aldolase